YEPARAAETMKQLYEKEQVFGVVGNVGTPTAVVALPYALERKMLFFGAFTGAGRLRRRSQRCPLAPRQRQQNFADQVPAHHRGWGRRARATPGAGDQNKSGDHDTRLSSSG